MSLDLIAYFVCDVHSHGVVISLNKMNTTKSTSKTDIFVF